MTSIWDSVCVRCFFFFQAEDGIRDIGVTGVQTCALPILTALRMTGALWRFWDTRGHLHEGQRWLESALALSGPGAGLRDRSEERRVGKECRSRWSPYH